MLETPHVIVGAAIAAKLGNPMLSIPLALASHYILDKIPHWNPHFYTETQKYGKPSKTSTTIAIVDSTLALGIGLAVAAGFLPDWRQTITVLATCLASVISDQIKLPYFFFKKRSGFFKKWTEFERSMQIDAPIIPGIITQIVVSLVGIWWLIQ